MTVGTAFPTRSARVGLASISPRGREVAAVATLVGLAAVVYLPHVLRGGLYLDDWIMIASMDDARRAGGLIGTFKEANWFSYRPGYAALITALHLVASNSPWVYLAMGTLLTAAQGSAFYIVLRLARLGRQIAFAAAAILVVLPYIDASRLWISAFPLNAALALYLFGLAAALHGLRQCGRRRRLAFHAIALTLFLAAILTYELVAPLVVVSACVYWAVANRSAALRRWPYDLAIFAAGLAFIAPRARARREDEVEVAHLLNRIPEVADSFVRVFLEYMPLANVFNGLLAIAVALIAMGGLVAARHRADDSTRCAIRLWVTVAGLGFVFSATGLAMLLPADSYFVPRTAGLSGRMTTAAAPGAVLLLVAAVALTSIGLTIVLRRPRWARAVTTAAIGLTFLNLTVREYRHQQDWQASWTDAQRVVQAVRYSMPTRVPRGAAIVTFGHRHYAGPDLPVFAAAWDLRGALWHAFDDPSVVAHPYTDEMLCGAERVLVPGALPGFGEFNGLAYGRLWFVDVTTGTSRRIRDQAACIRVRHRLAVTAWLRVLRT